MITERARLTELAFELSPAGILAVDREGAILLVNREAESLFGYEAGELNGRSIEILVPEEYRHRHPEYRQQFFAGPSARPMGNGVRLSGVCKDGTRIPVEVGLNPTESEDGLITLATVVDISAREMAEERFRIAVESAPSGMLMTNARGEIILANREIETQFKYTGEQLRGMRIEELIPERFHGHHPELRRSFFADPQSRAMGIGRDLYGLRSDGVEIPVEIGLNPISGPEGLSVLVSIADISRRKSAERQMRQSQKMEAVGTLAGGIAHDFNNILLNILGHAELVQFNLPRGSSEYDDLEQIVTAAQRGKALVERILTFSRQDVQETSAVDCVTVAREAMKLLRATTPSTITLHEIYEDNVPRILGNETQMHQVILNLVTNAVHAMPDGGVLHVSLSPWSQEDDESLADGEDGPRLPSGLYTRLTVRDAGAGIAAEDLERIFEPFYTTKGPGEGSGLGLSIIHGIVESIGGIIRVSSRVGEGTCFNVFLPAEPGAEADYGVADESEEKTRKHVMAVDDEKPLARLLGRQLDRMGYSVTSFHSSQEALSAFRKNPDRFDILITDSTMPKLSGVDLVKQIKAINPQLPVVFLSGHITDDKLEILSGFELTTAMDKPFSMHDLATTLNNLLDRAEDPEL